MKMLLALSIALLTVACATSEPVDTQLAQESCINREPATGSNIPTRVKCAAPTAEMREREMKRAEEAREDYRRREIRRPGSGDK
ncbi:MAG: hypothetical protein ABIS28_15275 [Caldimonas sp.]